MRKLLSELREHDIFRYDGLVHFIVAKSATSSGRSWVTTRDEDGIVHTFRYGAVGVEVEHLGYGRALFTASKGDIA